MDADLIKEELRNLYSQNWSGYIENVRKTTDSAYPFLILPRKSYCEHNKRIMICGQETQGWGNELDGVNPEEVSPQRIMNIYNGFVNSGAYNSPYWNFSHRIEEALPDARSVHNNIVKVGKRSGAGCNDSINALALQHFNVFRSELDILRPNVILFLTGPNYDWRIKSVLGEFSAKPVTSGMFIDSLTFSNPSLPPAVRTYHPGYIQRQGMFQQYAETIAKEISSIINCNAR